MKSKIESEFNLFVNLTKSFWNTSDCQDFDKFFKEVFNEGLVAGQLYVPSGLTIDIEQKLSKGSKIDLFSKRTQQLIQDPPQFLCDSFRRTDSWLNSNLSKLHNYVLETHNYDSKTRSISKRMAKKYQLDSLVPIDIPAKDEYKTTDAYNGLHLGAPGSAPTCERVTNDYASFRDSRDDSKSLYVLTSAIYAHAFFVAGHFNELAIKEAIRPIYKRALKDDYFLLDQSEINQVVSASPVLTLLAKHSPLIMATKEKEMAIRENAGKPSSNPTKSKEQVKKPSLKEFLDLNKSEVSCVQLDSMSLKPDSETGFAKYKDENCELVAVLATDEDSYGMLSDQIDMTIDFNDTFLEKLHEKLQEHYQSIGCLVKIDVALDKKGTGLGSELMSCYERDIGSKSDVDILFARIWNPQEVGFSLKKFYLERGFEPIKVSEGSLLMANKGKAKEIMQYLEINKTNSNELGLTP